MLRAHRTQELLHDVEALVIARSRFPTIVHRRLVQVSDGNLQVCEWALCERRGICAGSETSRPRPAACETRANAMR